MRPRSGPGATTIMMSRRFFQTSKIFGSVGLLIFVVGCSGGAVEKSKAAHSATAFAPETSAQKRTGVQPSDSPMNSSPTLDHSPTDPTPSVPPPFGHDKDCSDTGYSLWNKDCQTAANSFCNGKTAPCGIVICNKKNAYSPSSDDEVDGHAFNWMIEGKSTCFYNWGKKRCAEGNKSPPDEDKFADIFFELCGTQYVKGNPKIVEQGQSLPNLDATTCLADARSLPRESPYQFRECVDCCNKRTDVWNHFLGKNPLEFDQKLKFVNACNNYCRTLDPLATPPPRYTSLADRRGKRCGELSDFKHGVMDRDGNQYEVNALITMCLPCCSEAAKSGDFPSSEIQACHAICIEKMIPVLRKFFNCCKVPISDTGKCPVGTYEYGPAAKGTPDNFCLPMSCTQPSTLSGCPGT